MQSKYEYVARMQVRYLKAGRQGKHRLMADVREVTGYGRRHALRLLRRADGASRVELSAPLSG